MWVPTLTDKRNNDTKLQSKKQNISLVAFCGLRCFIEPN